MPFKSEKQRKWMHANEPEMADKWEKEEESVNEANARAGDYVKVITGEVGQVNKVKGKIAWIKLASNSKSFWPSDIRKLKPAGKEKGKNLWTEVKLNESDLGLTLKKGKTVKVRHKSSGKELIVIDKPNVRKEYEKIGYFTEAKGVKVARRVTLNLPDKKTGMDMETAKKILDIDAAYSRTPSLQKQFRKMEVKKMIKMMKNYYWEVLDKKLYDIIIEQTKRDYKAEYKKYGSSTKAKKYRAELNKYNRQKGTYGNGDGKDASHKGGKIVGFEAESKNRGRAEKSRLKKEARAILEADFTDDTLVTRLKHWSKQHKGTGIGYGHVLGHLAVHMKEMGWNKSYKEVARIAVELGKKKKVESIQNESGLQYRMGVKRYGKEGMTKIQSAAGSGADHAEIGAIKDKYDKKKKKKESVIMAHLIDMIREELEKYEGGYSKKWNKQRKKNAEVLGYKLSGKSDIKESAVSFWQDMFRPGPIPKQYINQLIKKKGELPSKSHIKVYIKIMVIQVQVN